VGAGLSGAVSDCFWDTETSGQGKSAGGTGKTTGEMQEIQTYQGAGWDFVGVEDGTCETWQMPEGGGYPVLAIFNGYTPPQLQGSGTGEDPYLICDARELGAMVHYSPSAHYRLAASIDLSGIRWGAAIIPWFGGTLDGNGHTISHLTINGGSYLGLFGQLGSGAGVKDLGIVDVNIAGSGNYIGGLVGYNYYGSITASYSTATVSGKDYVGGLVGYKYYGTITSSYSTGTVSGSDSVGGLVGYNYGTVTRCYSTGAVNGTGTYVGGLVGYNNGGTVTGCFWDLQTSGQTASDGGIGLPTVVMQIEDVFVAFGWDFVGESENGTENTWAICEGLDYPKLAWQFVIGDYNGDGYTDFMDFCILAEHWLQSEPPEASFYCGDGGRDLTNDGLVDFGDLMEFADNWLTGMAP